MSQDGQALKQFDALSDYRIELTEEEEEMLMAFRKFKYHLKKDGEVFTWQTRKPARLPADEDIYLLYPNTFEQEE